MAAFAPNMPGVEVAAVEVGVPSDAVATGLGPSPENSDVDAGAVVEAGGALVAAPVPKSPAVWPVDAPEPPVANGDVVAVGAAFEAAEAGGTEVADGLGAKLKADVLPSVVEVVVFGAASDFKAPVPPPKEEPVVAVGFSPPNMAPIFGCEPTVLGVASGGLEAPKRPPAGLFRPENRGPGPFALPLPAGVPAGVVEGAKLNMLPEGLLAAGVVEPRTGAPLVPEPAVLFAPPKTLLDVAGVAD